MNIFDPPLNKIKHADWPFILVHLAVYLVFLVVASLILNGTAQTVVFLILTLFILLIVLSHFYRAYKMEAEHLQYKIQAIGEIQKLLPLRAPLRPMTGWAATPELAVTVLRQVIFNKPQTIVELGSGITTLINGYALEKYNPDGKLISLDHDKDYAEITREEINQNGLNTFVDLSVAPLKDVKVNGEQFRWYDLSGLPDDIQIDLLVVDGPPVKTIKFARYPALPLMDKYLSDSCTIIIHDTNREEETGIVSRWVKEYPEFEADIRHTDKGITVLTRSR
jgi:predicted RNA methylase